MAERFKQEIACLIVADGGNSVFFQFFKMQKSL